MSTGSQFTLDCLRSTRPGLEEVEEHPLLVLVVGRVAGRDLAAPVERQPHRLELLLHRGDVGVGPFLGMDLALHGGVLGRHAEGVPAHRVQHVDAAGALEARDHVAHGVVADVAHVDAPRRVGEHLQHVVFRARVVVGDLEDAALVPGFLPAGFGFPGVVAVGFGGLRRAFAGSFRGGRRDGEGVWRRRRDTTDRSRRNADVHTSNAEVMP